jgi:hypothetical protein
VKVRIQRYDDRPPLAGQFEDLGIFGARKTEFTGMVAREPSFTQHGGRVARYALIEN